MKWMVKGGGEGEIEWKENYLVSQMRGRFYGPMGWVHWIIKLVTKVVYGI